MSTPPDSERYVREPSQLVDLCRDVIDRLDTGNDDTDIATMEAQLREIARAIDQLEKRNITVPDALRGEKTRLASALDMQSEARQALKYLADEFDEIAKELKTRLDRNDDPQATPRTRTRRSRLPKTDKRTLRRLIIEALQHFGGSAKKTEVLRFMEQQLEGKLLPGDVELLPDGRRVVWKNITDWECTYMRKVGILKDDSPRGVWELSETPR